MPKEVQEELEHWGYKTYNAKWWLSADKKYWIVQYENELHKTDIMQVRVGLTNEKLALILTGQA